MKICPSFSYIRYIEFCGKFIIGNLAVEPISLVADTGGYYHRHYESTARCGVNARLVADAHHPFGFRIGALVYILGYMQPMITLLGERWSILPISKPPYLISRLSCK